MLNMDIVKYYTSNTARAQQDVCLASSCELTITLFPV